MVDLHRRDRILVYQAGGILLLIALSWINELLHLPDLLFGGGHSSNWQEAAMETGAILCVWGGAAFW